MDYNNNQDKAPYYYTYEIQAGTNQVKKIALPTLTDYTRDSLGRHTNNHPAVKEVFEKVVQELEKTPEMDINPVLDAIDYAAIKHDGQFAKDITGIPYVYHPLNLCRILLEEGKVLDTNVLISALVHSTLEDEQATLSEIGELFGEEVYKILEDLKRHNLSIEDKQKLVDYAPHMCEGAKLIQLSMRIDSLNDIRNNPPIGWSQEEVEDCFFWSDRLLKSLKGINAGLEASLETVIRAQNASK